MFGGEDAMDFAETCHLQIEMQRILFEGERRLRNAALFLPLPFLPFTRRFCGAHSKVSRISVKKSLYNAKDF